MSLLTQAQIDSIKDAMQQVTDTFFVTPVLYKLGKVSLDVFQEDTPVASYTDYKLKALVEYSSMETDMIKEGEQGGESFQKIKMSLNYRDVKAVGLGIQITSL